LASTLSRWRANGAAWSAIAWTGPNAVRTWPARFPLLCWSPWSAAAG
jgi:hypothetical protein